MTIMSTQFGDFSGALMVTACQGQGGGYDCPNPAAGMSTCPSASWSYVEKGATVSTSEATGSTYDEVFTVAGGDPQKVYDVTVHVVGQVEGRPYQGGTAPPAPNPNGAANNMLYVGGKPGTSDNTYNVYIMTISPPPGRRGDPQRADLLRLQRDELGPRGETLQLRRRRDLHLQGQVRVHRPAHGSRFELHLDQELRSRRALCLLQRERMRGQGSDDQRRHATRDVPRCFTRRRRPAAFPDSVPELQGVEHRGRIVTREGKAMLRSARQHTSIFVRAFVAAMPLMWIFGASVAEAATSGREVAGVQPGPGPDHGRLPEEPVQQGRHLPHHDAGLGPPARRLQGGIDGDEPDEPLRRVGELEHSRTYDGPLALRGGARLPAGPGQRPNLGQSRSRPSSTT